VFRAGLEFNNPLITRKVDVHTGTLPKRWGLFQTAQPNVVMSAFKPGPNDSLILRLYEAAGKATKAVKIKLEPGVASASEANLMEDSTRKLDIENDILTFDLGPYEVKTFRIERSVRRAAK